MRHDINMGLCTARNTGIKAAKGEFIQFLDSDDEFLPEKTEKQLEIFLQQPYENEIGAVYCGLWMERNNQNQYFFQSSARYNWFFLLQRLMFRREIIEKVGFFDTYFLSAEDLDYVYRLSRICKFAGTREPLVIYHDSPVSITKNRDLMRVYEQLFLKKHSGTISPADRSLRLYYLGRDYLRDGCFVKGYKVFFRSFISCPLNEKSLRKLIRLSPGLLFHALKHKTR
jgi:glycosyltransferase involved in cell wall biosynthesis